jgi:cyclophilin family peptidyl-prolyl cis-trans isomerase
MNRAVLTTSVGLIALKLYVRRAPASVAHFAYLAEQGFYNGQEVFLYMPRLIWQTGCPYNNGRGGCGYQVNISTDTAEQLQEGQLIFAHIQPNTVGSQFYCLLDTDSFSNFGEKQVPFAEVQSGSYATMKKLRKGAVIQQIEVMEELDKDPQDVFKLK